MIPKETITLHHQDVFLLDWLACLQSFQLNWSSWSWCLDSAGGCLANCLSEPSGISDTQKPIWGIFSKHRAPQGTDESLVVTRLSLACEAFLVHLFIPLKGHVWSGCWGVYKPQRFRQTSGLCCAWHHWVWGGGDLCFYKQIHVRMKEKQNKQWPGISESEMASLGTCLVLVKW